MLLCPRCGDAFRFSSVSELRVHLITQHTYETLLLLNQAGVRTSRPRSLLPLPGPSEAQTLSSSLGMELQESPRPLEGLDLALSSSSALVLPRIRLTQAFLMVDIGLEERLGLGFDLGSRIFRTLEEVEERVNHKVEWLQSRLHHKEVLLRRQRDTEGKLRAERQELNTRVVHLTGQVCAAKKLMEKLRNQLKERETELRHKQQEMEQIESFLQGLAQREAEAKVKLQVFIESLLDRAEYAERQLLLLNSRAGVEDLARRLQESRGNRRSFSLSDSDPGLRIRFVEGGWGQTWNKPRHHSNEEGED